MEENRTTAQYPRIIMVDTKKITGSRNTMWKHCVGAGRVGEGLVPEWQRQMTFLSKEIGFERMRCHGLYHDELSVYKEDSEGRPVYDFTKIDVVWDFLLSVGVRPYVELGPTPEAMASSDKTTFWWKGNFSVPKNLDRWSDLVTATVRHWIGRYGIEEVSGWWFEVWNEPNLLDFFRPKVKGEERKEYFEMYARTAQALKAVDPRLRVGGPASAGGGWIQEMMDYCYANKVPLDFISSHVYATHKGPDLDEFGKAEIYFAHDLQAIATMVKKSRTIIDASPYKGIPFHLTEWSTSPSSRCHSHDSYHSAPFILEQLKNSEDAAQSMSYWVFTDIFEEAGPVTKPFEGCFGLITVDGIRKPSYFAYAFLSRLGDTELVNADDRSWACSDSRGGVQILLWDYRHPVTGDKAICNRKYFSLEHPAEKLAPVNIEVLSLKPGEYAWSATRVGYRVNDAFTHYMVDLKRPSALTPEQLAFLNAKADGAPENTGIFSVDPDGRFEISIPMREFDCVLLELSPVIS